jgi:hypothetical protein
MANLCGTCKYFSTKIENPVKWATPSGHGVCKRIPFDDESQPAFVIDGECYFGELMVRPDFGCILWEGK